MEPEVSLERYRQQLNNKVHATELKIKLMSFKAAADDWARHKAEEKKKWNKWYASPEEKKKEARAEAQKTKVHQGWKEMERKQEAKKEKRKKEDPEAQAEDQKGEPKEERLYYCSGGSSSLQQFRGKHQGREERPPKLPRPVKRIAYRDWTPRSRAEREREQHLPVSVDRRVPQPRRAVPVPHRRRKRRESRKKEEGGSVAEESSGRKESH